MHRTRRVSKSVQNKDGSITVTHLTAEFTDDEEVVRDADEAAFPVEAAAERIADAKLLVKRGMESPHGRYLIKLAVRQGKTLKAARAELRAELEKG